MIAVNLDDIIHYRPPPPKHHCKPLQAPSFARHHPSPSASDTFLLTHQVRPCITPSTFPTSTHSPSLQDHAQDLQFLTSLSSDKTQDSPSVNTSLPKQPTIETPNEFDKELLNSDTTSYYCSVMSHMYSVGREAQNGSICDNRGQESCGLCTDDFREDALHEPSLQPIFKDRAAWEDISDLSQAVEFAGQTDLNSFADKATVDVVAAQVSACDKMANSTIAYEKSSMSTNRDSLVRQGNSPSRLLNSPHVAKDNLQPSTCSHREGVDTENPSNNQPATANQYMMEEATGHAAAPDNQKAPELNNDGSHATSYQFDANKASPVPISPALQQPDEPASRSVEEDSSGAWHISSSPAAVVPGLRSRFRESRTKGSLSRLHSRCPGKRKDRTEPPNDDDNDDPDDPDEPDYPNDRNYMEESDSDLHSGFFRPKKKPRRTTAHARHKAANHSPAEATLASKSSDYGDHVCSSTSLHDIETIPIRGFLTRQIFLSRVVYSFTFEEQREMSCSHSSDEVPEIRCESRHSKSLSSKESRAVSTSKGTRFLPEDDKLLIKLKEERNLPWSQIVEYFPRRSKGSLQVRYCTKLKNRGIKSRGQNTNTIPQSSGTGRGSSRNVFDLVLGSRAARSRVVGPASRYGPPRTRRVVDRFSPV